MTMNPFDSPRNGALIAYHRVEHGFDAVFGARLNPWRHLGALGFLFFWIITVSGLYLYAVLDTSVDGVYRSITWLSREQWYAGGVLRSLHRYAADAFLLRMPAGDIPVRVADDVWTLQAIAPMSYPVDVPRADLTAMIGLTADRVAAEPLWVDAGTVQLILPLRSAQDVRAASADPKLLTRFATRPDGESLVYLWAPTGPDTIEARLFFTQNHAVVEDPATGSACANLGGWFLANGQQGIRRRIHQGSAIRRPSVLDLAVGEDGTILVSGTVREVGRGTFTI